MGAIKEAPRIHLFLAFKLKNIDRDLAITPLENQGFIG
jgi:hypothetical protein